MTATLDRLVSEGRMASDWAQALAPVEADLQAALTFLAAEESAGRGYLPAADRVLRAFERPLASVKVLLLGQDPYPTPGHAVGLAFSVAPEVRPLPGSLRNILRELVDDTRVPLPTTGDLSPWADRGVLLLNRALSVAPGPGTAGSHLRAKVWQPVTDRALAALAARGGPLVAVLWGAKAAALAPTLRPVPSLMNGHPSPQAVNLGGAFSGSRPFTRANTLLVAQGGEPVDWRLP